ncbi:cutinase family protein [Mycobacterium sp. OTB74]|uniref:cutinase family protein n=1 Tax=Mycobacterium sp. OTB74 TaxID=1853452 RepID=UPI002473A520|nr:cutinase family protein [Mycobacterium sp. OTB74]
MKVVRGSITAVLPLISTLAGFPFVTAPAAAEPASADRCPNVQVVFARGTMEPPGVGKAGQAFVDSLAARTGTRTVDVYAVDYPASLDFATAADGVVDAANKVQRTVATCPDTKIVLGGYSQGAAVAAYITEDTVPSGVTMPVGFSGPMPASVANHVAAVVLFGKPSSGFLQMVYTGAPPINVGPRYTSKTLDLCISQDPVCAPAGTDNGAHEEYSDARISDRAAEFVVGKLGSPAPGTVTPSGPGSTTPRAPGQFVEQAAAR